MKVLSAFYKEEYTGLAKFSVVRSFTQCLLRAAFKVEES